jgi:hypothetical protein
VKKLVFKHTNGHLYETHVLCSHLFDNQIRGKVTLDVFEPALKLTLETLGEEVFSGLFESASDSEQLVLDTLARSENEAGFGEITERAKKTHNLSKLTVASALERLVEKRIIIKPKRGSYLVEDNLFKIFIVRKFG